jgi:hypothetical protein
VTQAVASFVFDPLSQRPVVTLWIAGDANAPAAAAAALAGTAMPNEGLRIIPAIPVDSLLSLTYVRDPRYDDAAVQASLTVALLDPNTGPLGNNVVGIGQSIYQSQIDAACMAVPGVMAIQNVVMTPPGSSLQRYSPGAGSYFSVLNDGQHLLLNWTTSS